jgi:hypothetical protein
MAVTQKIKRAPLDIFILLVLFYAPAFRISCVETQLTLCGSITGYCAVVREEGKRNLSATAAKPIKRCNKKVTDLLPGKCEARAKRLNRTV